ncbi:hypothetical protein BDM02DRAFT_1546075 [Thelephora ganbajun]|uniref:Uncharacterized protein n=1 Tax=Thelephora ganbajun TaxID=370292 RepID=A0ACB6Z117_THEGA|nr:hypothetical protein BDM02DRAFT_1546075 [Thelephora ganbajun]
MTGDRWRDQLFGCYPPRPDCRGFRVWLPPPKLPSLRTCPAAIAYYTHTPSLVTLTSLYLTPPKAASRTHERPDGPHSFLYFHCDTFTVVTPNFLVLCAIFRKVDRLEWMGRI